MHRELVLGFGFLSSLFLVIKIPKLTVTCRRPTTLQDRTRDSDEEDRDYDVAALANNLSQAFRYKIYGNDDNEEVYSHPSAFFFIYE